MKNYLVGLLLICPSLTFATECKTTDYGLSGYIDTSYNYLVRNHEFISGVNDRENDLTQNGFTLQGLSVTFAKLPEQGFGGIITAFLGRDAYSIAPYGWNPYLGSQTLAFILPQAYLQYAIGPYTFIGGMLRELAGEEDFDVTKDTNFSRSILDGYAEPGATLGVRGYYEANDKWTFNLGLNDGWSTIRDTSKSPTIEYGVLYTVNTMLSLILQGSSGEQRLLTDIATGPKGRRNFINLIGTLQVTNKLTLIASGDYATQSKALSSEALIQRVNWLGVSGYVNYQFTEKWRTSVRGEIYDDQNGYTTGVKQNWRELTLTLGYVPIKHVELRAETRHDFSNVNAFKNATGAGVNNNQQSFAFEAIYSF